MSYPLAYYDYWQAMWDKHAPEYFKWCAAHNMQADLSEFSLWCEEQNLVGEDNG